jgi:hypothetical protein
MTSLGYKKGVLDGRVTSLGYKKGVLDGRVDCIKLVMKGTKKPVQNTTLKALQRDRLRIAKLIAGKNQYLRRLVDSYTMASEENKV